MSESTNIKLHRAKVNRNDEFYTQFVDIENELRHYKNHFKGKIVLLNCDDPYESNFFKYFAMNFNYLKLKKLIATCYSGSPVAGTELPILSPTYGFDKEPGYKIVIEEVDDYNKDGAIDLADVEYLLKNHNNTMTQLEGDGDFRSEECIELLKEADIVVTNPPFSLFREYVAQLVEYDKSFVIIGNKNSITYKKIFPLLKENIIWTGYRGFSGGMWFIVPNDSDNYDKVVERYKLKNIPSIWYTNLDIPKRHEELILWRKYNEKDYPRYDNYDAINVNKVAEIPVDYYGVMGVPISFLNKHNPEQFEILGMCENLDLYGLKTKVYTAQECKDRYFELFNKKGVYDLNAAGVVNGKKVYQRVLIRRKDMQ